MSSVLLNLLFLCLVTSSAAVEKVLNISSKSLVYARLRNELLKRDAVVHKIPPEIACRDGEHFTLTFSFLLVDILEIDDIQQMMTIIAYIRWSWTHDDLQWDKADYGGLQEIMIESDAVWVPDVTILVGQKDSLHLAYPTNLIVNSAGLLLCATQTYVTFRCEVNFKMYPFDTQRCHFELNYNSLLSPHKVSHVLEDMNKNNSIFIAEYTTVGEWSLKQTGVENYHDLNNISHSRYIFIVQRRSVFYTITILFPMVLTSVMVTLVFLIPASTGEKISYLVSIYTSTAIFLSFISDVMPRNLASMPYLAALLVEVLLQGLGATLASIWVVKKFEAENTKMNLHSEIQRKNLALKVNPCETKHQHRPEGLDESDLSCRTLCDLPAMCHLTSRRLDRIFFVFFAIFQAIFLGILLGATEWTRDGV